MRELRDYLVFPLDVASLTDAEACVRQLNGHVGMFKVGLELFALAGPGVIGVVRDRAPGARIFLDLKLHDIPVTIRRTMERISDMGVDFVTVHCGGGRAMLEAAVQGGRGRVGVLGVTVLTSLSPEDIRNAGYQERFASDVGELARLRAGQALSAGCAGVVCSGKEVRALKSELGGGFVAVTPGIRPLWDGVGADDQRRVVTPAQAVLNGADYLVIGRPIRDAADPAAAADRILDEIRSAIEGLHPGRDG